MTTKHCAGCDLTLALSEFYFRPSKGRLCSRCKSCSAAARKAWKASNPQKVKEQKRKHRARNIDRYRELARAAAVRHSDKNVVRAAEWRAANRDRYNAKSRACLARRRQRLADAYVADKLGLSVAQARPLIEAKRAQLRLHRELKGTTNDHD